MINWIVRVKNKNFWLAAIPALLLLVQTVAALFGFYAGLGRDWRQAAGRGERRVCPAGDSGRGQ